MFSTRESGFYCTAVFVYWSFNADSIAQLTGISYLKLNILFVSSLLPSPPPLQCCPPLGTLNLLFVSWPLDVSQCLYLLEATLERFGELCWSTTVHLWSRTPIFWSTAICILSSSCHQWQVLVSPLYVCFVVSNFSSALLSLIRQKSNAVESVECCTMCAMRQVLSLSSYRLASLLDK